LLKLISMEMSWNNLDYKNNLLFLLLFLLHRSVVENNNKNSKNKYKELKLFKLKENENFWYTR
jgi:hypothetical protein